VEGVRQGLKAKSEEEEEEMTQRGGVGVVKGGGGRQSAVKGGESAGGKPRGEDASSQEQVDQWMEVRTKAAKSAMPKGQQIPASEISKKIPVSKQIPASKQVPASEVSRELLNAFNEGTPKWAHIFKSF
jgi:hypothetical protein